ncbi:KR domain-containing protein [Colletotrichum cereale]|nr:KR domain-containing protein [Colletotrichum cereale]
MEGIDKKLRQQLPYTSALVRKENATTTALKAAGHLWALGYPVALAAVNREATERASKPQVVVDLPAYPWNHEKTFWHESAATKELRLQHQPRTDLLGAPIENQNPFEPEWRNFLSVRESPWVEDHKITGTTLYPGAGMLIMVVEAAKQIAVKDAVTEGIEFRNVTFDRGLVIPSDGAVETRLSLTTPTADNAAYSFSVFSRLGDAPWARHCWGSFTIFYKDTEAAVSDNTLTSQEWKTYIEAYETLKITGTDNVDIKKLYENLEALGMAYGPTFRNLTSLVTCPEQEACYGTIAVPDTKSIMPFGYEYPHVIHPAMLDAIFHLIVVAVGGGPSMTEAAVPYQLEKMYIASDLPSGAGAVFSGYSKRTYNKDKLMTADLIATDTAWSAPKVVLKGLVMRQVTSGSADSDASNDSITKRTTQLIWKPDPATVLESSAGAAAAPGTQSLQITSLRDWIELECHRSPKQRVLLAASTLPATILEELAPFTHGGTHLYRGITHCTVVAQSEKELETWKAHTLTAKTLFEYRNTYPTAEGPEADLAKYDVIIVGGSGSVNTEELGHILHPNGRLLIWQAATPGGLTHGSQASLKLPAGFQSMEISLDAEQTLIIAGLSQTSVQAPAAVSLLVPDSVTADTNDSVAAIIRSELHSLGVQADFVHWKDIPQVAGSKPVISLLDLCGQVINDWTSTHFEQFQQLVADASHIFWITKSGLGDQPSEDGLRSATAPGLFRVLRNEYPQLKLAHLDLSPGFDLTAPGGAKLIVNTWLRTCQPSSDTDTAADLEFGEWDGHILLPRVVTAPGMDEEVALSEGTAPAISTSLARHPSLRLTETGSGLVWTTDGTNAEDPLSSEEVVIRVSHLSVDCDQLDPEAATEALLEGNFVTGVITRAGFNSTGLRIGDRVLAVGGGNTGCHTLVRRDRSLVLRCPDVLDSTAAATEAWLHMTALYVAGHVSRVERDDVVLIENGSTGLGQALLYAARRAGARVITTVGTLEDKARLLKRFGLGDEAVVVLRGASDLSSLDTVLASKVGGGGVDVVVASASQGAVLVSMLTTSLSDFARVILIGSRSGAAGAPLAVRRNVQVAAIDPMQVLRQRPALAAQLLSEAAVALADPAGLLSATGPAKTTLSVAELPAARAWLEKPTSSGILSVEFAADAVVPLAPAPPPPLQLDGSATFVLAGGLGQLGLRIGDLLVAHGAKHLCFLSRSGNRARHEDRLAAMESHGCQVAIFACDIGSADAVRDVVAQITKLGRPIKGLIQCAMDLQDSLFPKMNYTQWRTSLAPKVSGTWNLHAALPADLDFFVMLSSVVSIIGNIAQSNYAAGNSYMDTLARFRRARGLAATSINAGLVRDTDHTVDGTHMTDYLARFTHIASVSTDLDELIRGIIAAIRGTTANGEPVPPQFVFCMTDSLRPDGVDTWAGDAKFVHRVAVARAVDDSGSSAAGPSVAESLRSATSLEEAVLVVQEALKALLAPGLGIQPGDISDESPLYDIGVDSFKAVEVRNRVFRDLESEISVFEVLSPSTLAQTSRIIATRSRLVSAEVRAADNTTAE